MALLGLFGGRGFDDRLIFEAGMIPARLLGVMPAGVLPPWSTLVTHMFVHGGLLHLAMNMVFLLWVGRNVEWALGPWRAAAIFLVGGVAGGILEMILSPGSTMPVVGASGAVSALFAVYALLFGRPGDAPGRFLGIALSPELVRALRFAALWVGLQLLTAVAFNAPGEPTIAIWAHVGGFLAGLAIGYPLARRLR